MLRESQQRGSCRVCICLCTTIYVHEVNYVYQDTKVPKRRAAEYYARASRPAVSEHKAAYAY